ncbi:unnamed protein product [Cuscuta campestris]|uniref:PI-PLC Y-box domain-containing protein n=1 Tax=Cuscuta campestris TaxID=132261 RepID=A0A484M3H3_9ASTE|nr:unnamed protein product [Cuscuta campestris]
MAKPWFFKKLRMTLVLTMMQNPLDTKIVLRTTQERLWTVAWRGLMMTWTNLETHPLSTLFYLNLHQRNCLMPVGKTETPSEGFPLKKVEVGDVVRIPAEGVSNLEEEWGFCLVGCFTGRFPGIKAIEGLISSWHLECKLHPHKKGWVIFQFLSDEDRSKVLHNGPYVLYGKTLLLRILPEGFRFDFDAFMTVDVWVKYVDVPLQLWNPVAFECLGSRVGTPIRTDGGTKNKGRLSYCRMLIQVDMSKELPTSFVVSLPDGEEFTQKIVYEGLPNYCFHCKKFGHNQLSCRVIRALNHRKSGNYFDKCDGNNLGKDDSVRKGAVTRGVPATAKPRRRRRRSKRKAGSGPKALGSHATSTPTTLPSSNDKKMTARTMGNGAEPTAQHVTHVGDGEACSSTTIPKVSPDPSVVSKSTAKAASKVAKVDAKAMGDKAPASNQKLQQPKEKKSLNGKQPGTMGDDGQLVGTSSTPTHVEQAAQANSKVGASNTKKGNKPTGAAKMVDETTKENPPKKAPWQVKLDKQSGVVQVLGDNELPRMAKGKKKERRPPPPTPPNKKDLRNFLRHMEDESGAGGDIVDCAENLDNYPVITEEDFLPCTKPGEVRVEDDDGSDSQTPSLDEERIEQDLQKDKSGIINAESPLPSDATAGKADNGKNTGNEIGKTHGNTPGNKDDTPKEKKSLASLFERNRSEDKGMKLHQVDMAEDEEVFIQPEDVTPMEELWGPCLVGCFTGRFPGLAPIQSLVESWKVPCQFLPHHKVWVKLMDVPMQFWGHNSLSKIASKLGKPLFTNGLTNKVASKFTLEEDPDDKLAYKKPNFCRVLIHMDLSKPPPSSVKVNFVGGSYMQHVEYEDLPLYCYHCEKFAHTPFDCFDLHEMQRKEIAEEQRVLDKARVEVMKTSLLADNDKEKEKPKQNQKGKQILEGTKGWEKPADPNEASPSFSKKDDNDGFTLVGKGRGSLTTHPLKEENFNNGNKQPHFIRETRSSGRGHNHGNKGGTNRGDLNSVLNSSERLNCHTYAYDMTDLLHFRLNNDLIDAKSTGTHFTWNKGNKWAKLDRVMVKCKWEALQWDCWAEFKHMEFQSDHCPILLHLIQSSTRGPKPFKFFNMWLKHDSFDNTLKHVWDMRINGTRQFRLCKKLKLLKHPLKQLNNKDFAHISSRAEEARKSYTDLMDKLYKDPDNLELL